MLLDSAGFILLFYDFISSRFGVLVTFGLIVSLIIIFGVKASLKSLSSSFIPLLLWVILPTITMLVYGFSGFDAKFMFFIPIWDEFVYDNVMSVMGAMIIILYTSIIIFRYYKTDVDLNFDLFEYIVGSYVIVGIIAYVIIPKYNGDVHYYTAGDMYVPHIILLSIGMVSKIYGTYTKSEEIQKNAVYIGTVVFYAGLIGFVLTFMIEEISAYISVIGSVAVCCIGIVQRNRREKTVPLVTYCKDHLDEDICHVHFLNLDTTDF